MLLKKTDVVHVALRFLDAEGLDGLTMRRLGAALNVQGGALYRHFPNKAALLEAMAAKLLEGIGSPLPDVSWREQIYILGDRFRTALLSHRDGARLVSGNHAAIQAGGANAAIVIEVLCDAGLTPAQAGPLAFALYYFVLGHTIEEQAAVDPATDHQWQTRDIELSPRHAAALEALMTIDRNERFAYGLKTFIEGVASTIEPTRTAQVAGAARLDPAFTEPRFSDGGV